ncbi:MAG: sodium:solute symporter family protein, partial [Pseudomonadota bacterium]|nr:sodium:solute symporter family protein [Pseudomonadota bacterium]
MTSLGFYVILYLAVTLCIGVAASFLIRGARDFLLASRRLPFAVSSMALFALWYGSETVFGASAEFIENGLIGVMEDPFGAFLCLVLFGLFLVRPLYRRNLVTLGDLFRDAYGPRVELVASFCMILTFVGYIAAQLVALGILFELVFGLDPLTGRVLSALIVTVYTTAGGMWAVSITDFVQSLIIMAGMVLLCIYLGAGSDQAVVFTPPRDNFFDFFPSRDNGASWLDWTAAWLTLGLGSLASQDIFQRANSARSENIAVFSTLFGAGLYLVFAMAPLYLALLVFHREPALVAGDAQYALLQLVQGYAPFWLQVCFYGALLSAVFSTCSGALLAPSSILAENLFRPLLLRDADDRRLLIASRVAVVLMAVVATTLTFFSDSIYDLVAESSVLGAVSILVPMLYALFGHKPSAAGAVASMLLGLVAYVSSEYGYVG